MLNKFILIFISTVFTFKTYAQVLYSERFNTQSLITNTYTASGVTKTYLYNNLPSAMFSINNGSLIADTLAANYPFSANGQKQKAWLTYKQTNQTDTFAVSTSWLRPLGTADAWLVTPTINSITANTILMWEAMSPDATFLDGYEVYVTTNTTSTPTIFDFSAANKIFSISQESNTWQTRGLSLAAYAGQNIRIAFRNNSTDKFQLWIDDIIVKNITNGFDVATTTNNTYKYSTIATNNIISATFKNEGFSPITNITINYKVGSNPVITETQTLTTSLSYLDSKQLNFSVQYITSTPSYNTLKIWVSMINGVTDQQHLNDTINSSLTISTGIASKKMLVEQYTGAWCGWCPDGQSVLSTLTNTNIVLASLHYNDKMNTKSINTLVNDYVSVFPSATIDQYLLPSKSSVAIERLDWNAAIIEREAMVVPATITLTGVSYNQLTREINATVSSTFLGDVKGDYRLNLYVKENNVFGNLSDSLLDNGWNQHSYLYNTASSPYYQFGNYLDETTFLMGSNRYKHQNVIDTLLSGPYGASGIIPLNATTIGQTFSKAYTYTLSTPITTEFRYNANNIYLIGVLSEYNANANKRTILNVAEVKLNSQPETNVGLHEELANDFKVNLFPNPTTNQCQLTYFLKTNELVTINIYNVLGNIVYSNGSFENAGTVTRDLFLVDLSQGTYSVEVKTNLFKTVKKITIIK